MARCQNQLGGYGYFSPLGGMMPSYSQESAVPGKDEFLHWRLLWLLLTAEILFNRLTIQHQFPNGEH